jgi:prepilin-type N-terminal cleavage/methylation domain-containing protein
MQSMAIWWIAFARIARERQSEPQRGSERVNPLSDILHMKSDGFTLVEIVITIVLVGIIAGVAAMIILPGIRSYAQEEAHSEVHYQARLGMERMAREIRLVRSQTDITTMAANTFQYADIAGNQMGFQVTGNTLFRSQNGPSLPLATGSNVVLNFTYLRQDGTPAAVAAQVWFVVINLTVQQGSESLQLRTRVHPMNF